MLLQQAVARPPLQDMTQPPPRQQQPWSLPLQLAQLLALPAQLAQAQELGPAPLPLPQPSPLLSPVTPASGAP